MTHGQRAYEAMAIMRAIDDQVAQRKKLKRLTWAELPPNERDNWEYAAKVARKRQPPKPPGPVVFWVSEEYRRKRSARLVVRSGVAKRHGCLLADGTTSYPGRTYPSSAEAVRAYVKRTEEHMRTTLSNASSARRRFLRACALAKKANQR